MFKNTIFYLPVDSDDNQESDQKLSRLPNTYFDSSHHELLIIHKSFDTNVIRQIKRLHHLNGA